MKILKRNVIEICKNSNVIINPADIEGCNRLPLGRTSTTVNKHVIVKFRNRKNSEPMLRSKKSISSSKFYINHSLCLYYPLHKKESFPIKISSVNMTKSAVSCFFSVVTFTEEINNARLHFLCSNRYIWGKWKDLQREDKVGQVFYLGWLKPSSLLKMAPFGNSSRKGSNGYLTMTPEV